MNYFLGIAIALDQLINAFIGGDPDEMISSRAFRESQDSRYWAIAHDAIDALFFWQTDHCKNAWEYEREIIAKKAENIY